MKQTVLLFTLVFFVAPLLVPIGAASHIQEGDECAWNTQPSTSTLSLLGIHGTAPNDVWSVGRDDGAPADGDIVHYDGVSWSHFQDVSLDLQAVFARTPNDVWVAQGSTTPLAGPYHYTGTTFAQTTSNTAFARSYRGIFATAANNAWAVDSNSGVTNHIHHWTGASWAVDTSFTSLGFLGLSGSSGSDIWAVGGTTGGTEAWHYDGVSWSQKENGLPINTQFVDVFVASPTSAYMIRSTSSDTNVYHWDGTSWSAIPTGYVGSFVRMYGISDDQMWIATNEGKVVHKQGNSWITQSTGSSTVLIKPFATDTDNVWVVGQIGIVKQEACHPCVGTYGQLTTNIAPALLTVVIVLTFSAAIVGGTMLRFRRTMLALIVAGTGMAGIIAPSRIVAAAHHCSLTTGSMIVDIVGLPAFALMLLFLIVGVVFYVTRRTGGY